MALVRQQLPEVFSGYDKLGGVLSFAIFDECPDVDSSLRKAIGVTIEDIMGQGSVMRDRLEALTWRPLTRQAFLGPWADAETGVLRMCGDYTTSRGRKLVDPSYEELEALRLAGHTIASGGVGIPDLWEGGQFAFAFSDPPYGLYGGTPGEVQSVFTDMLNLILPRDRLLDIRDWGSPDLPDMCPDYFLPGTEWWGVFLFTIHDRRHGTVTVIAGSSTD